MTDWIMIAITAVYVIATIFICIANLRSAKATREQLAEQKRQFDETNCPTVDVVIDTVQGAWLGFVFHNTGKKLARDIKVKINNEFVSSLEGDAKEPIAKLANSTFSLGINQQWAISFCNLGGQKELSNARIVIDYRDDKKEYHDEFIFDLQKFNWMMVDTTDFAQIRKHLKKVAEAKEKEVKLLGKIISQKQQEV